MSVQPNQLGDSSMPTARDDRKAADEDQRDQPPAFWLVLALVIEKPSHGYEIDRRYASRFGWFLPLSTSRVYSLLDRLHDVGMIEQIALESAERPRKQHGLRRSYRATPAGARAYRRWVAERMRDDPQRAELLGRVASTGLLGVDAVLDVVDRYERESMQELMALPADSPALERGECSLEELSRALVVDQRRRELRAGRDWVVHARQALEAHRRHIAAERAGGGS
jgi:DNA-binding PadR family transcriptional regulator